MGEELQRLARFPDGEVEIIELAPERHGQKVLPA